MLTPSTINNSKLNNAFLNINPQYHSLKCETNAANTPFMEQYHNLNYQSSTNDFEEDSDISNEVNAELKINKIDKKLNKKSITINKVDKRRLQNRRSALKCRLRKA